MNRTVAIIGSLVLLVIAAFCVFGVLATFEPTENAVVFRVVYAVVGVGCLVGAGWLAMKSLRE